MGDDKYIGLWYVQPEPPFLIDMIQALLIVLIIAALHYCFYHIRGGRHDKA